MLNLSPNTAQISGITVELDSLHKSYLAIFQEAKAQLEHIDLTDSHLDTVAGKIGANSTFRGNLASEFCDSLAKNIGDLDKTSVDNNHPLQGLVESLETRIWNRIHPLIHDVISTIVEAQITTAVDKAIAECLTNNQTIQRGTTALDLINQLQQLATVNEQTPQTTTETD
jgi:hypothetical protein